MRKKGVVLLAVVFLNLLVVVSASAQKSLLLRYKFKKGDKFLLKSDSKMEMSQTVQNQQMTEDTATRQTMKFEVLEVAADGGAKIKMTTDSIYFKTSSPQGSFEYDSTKPATEAVSNPMLKFFEIMKGESITLKLSPLGKVSELKGLDEILNKTVDAMDVPKHEVKQQMKEMMKKMFGGKYEEMMSQSFISFPEDAVKAGDTWSSDFNLNIISPMHFKTLNKFVELKDNKAIIETKLTVKPGEEKKPLQLGGMTMEMELSGEITMTNKIDVNTGLVLDGSQKMNLSGQLKAQPIPQQPPMSIPMSMKGTATLQMIKQ